MSSSFTSEVHVATVTGPLGFERVVIVKQAATCADGARDSAAVVHEARALARVAHPGVVRLLDFCEVEGTPTLVLEHVAGVSLSVLVAALGRVAKTLPAPAALYVGARVLEALAALHTARDPITRELSPILHLDIHPANVLLSWDGDVKIGDLRSAHFPGASPQRTRALTRYSAPEQRTGCGALTVRTDVFSASLLIAGLVGDRASAIVCAALALGARTEPDARELPAEELAKVIRESVDLAAGREELVRALHVARQQTGEEPGEITISATSSFTDVHSADTARPPPPPPAVAPQPAAPPLPPTERRRSVAIETPTALAVTPTPSSRRGDDGRRRWALVLALVAGLSFTISALAARASYMYSTAARGRPAPRVVETSMTGRATLVRSHAPPPPLDETSGVVAIDEAWAAHRVFIDGRLVGAGGSELTLPCGRHVIILGGRGRPRDIRVPCGGVVAIGADGTTTERP